MHPNVETFIGCDSSYRAASIVLYGASGTRALASRLTAPTRTPT